MPTQRMRYGQNHRRTGGGHDLFVSDDEIRRAPALDISADSSSQGHRRPIAYQIVTNGTEACPASSAGTPVPPPS